MNAFKKSGLAYTLLGSIVTIGAVAALWFVSNQPASSVPGSILQQLDFKPFVVVSTKAIIVDPKTYKYDRANKNLSFIVSLQGLENLTVSEQTTPPQFIDIPDYYSKWLDTLNRYSAFDNQFGTVYLTQPNTRLPGQAAILHANGVLLFAYSEKNLSDDKWRQVFNTLYLY